MGVCNSCCEKRDKEVDFYMMGDFESKFKESKPLKQRKSNFK